MRYLTRAGAYRFQAQLIELRSQQRPRIVAEVADAAAQGDRSENAEYIYGKKKLREIDRNIRRLVKILDDAQLVDPTTRGAEPRAFFGATLTLETEAGEPLQYQLVGPEEADIRDGKLSYRSPLGALLLGKQAGDEVTLRLPLTLS